MPDPIDLSVPDLATLHERRSDKWARQPPDVLASTIAELDFPLAASVAAALHAAIDRHDLGYPPAAPARLRESLAGFAARRLRWAVDPEQVTLVPDVMAGVLELCRALLAPGEAVAFATPAYPPFLAELPQSASAPRRAAAATGRRVRPRRARAGARGRHPRARAREPAQPDRPRAAADRALRDRGALRRPRRLGAGGRDPRAARPAGRRGDAVPRGRRRRARVRDRPHLGVEGLQRRGPEDGARRDGVGARGGGRRAAAGAHRPRRPARRRRGRGRVHRRRRVARRGAGAARREPQPARRDRRARPSGRRVDAAAGELPRLAGLPRPRLRRRPRRPLPRPRPRRAEPRPRLRQPRRRLRPAQLRHEPRVRPRGGGRMAVALSPA